MRNRRLLPLLAASLLLASCGTTGKPDRQALSKSAPNPPPAAICAELEDEPLPPAGIDIQVLYGAIAAALGPEKGQAFTQWLDAEWASWARRGWRRLEQGRDGCPIQPNPGDPAV